MSSFADVFKNLALQTGFATLTWKHYVMILIACVFMYLAIVKGFEPLLLVPISFGMFLVNMFPDIIADGGLLHYFYLLDEWSILPSLIFMGVGAMTDFGPLIANPKSFLLGAAAQFGIYAAYFLAFLMGFNGKEAAAISIIGGADGPTSIFLAGKLGMGGTLMGPIAVAAYSIYVTSTGYPAADHEASHNREGEKGQDGSAPSGIQDGEDPVPNHRYISCCIDSSYNSSAGWYADAR